MVDLIIHQKKKTEIVDLKEEKTKNEEGKLMDREEKDPTMRSLGLNLREALFQLILAPLPLLISDLLGKARKLMLTTFCVPKRKNYTQSI